MGKRSLSRRDFLKTAGAAAGGLVLSGCPKQDPYALDKPDVPGAASWRKGQEKWILSTCGQCPAGCGIRVRVVEGRAVKIEGNEACPLNRGGLGPKGQSGLQLLYHPDRVRHPLKRDGPRGSGRWQPVTWEEAIAEIGQQLRELRARGEPRGLVVLDGEARGPMFDLWERFCQAYGSPNHIDHRATTDGARNLAMAYMHGVDELPAFDWENTHYVLGFGSGLLESWSQTIHFLRASRHLWRGVPGRRVKFVLVSSRYSVTATKADEWVAIEPATYGALALGLAHVLVKNELYDTAFVREHTFGFEDWQDVQGRTRRGFRDLVLKDYPVETVERITGIATKTIERLAREMAAHRPAIVLTDDCAAAATNGLGTAMAIHALNALLGNLERPGGLLVQRRAPLAPWPTLKLDELARTSRAAPRIDGTGTQTCPLGHSFIQTLPEAILSDRPYPIEALILYRSNPVFSKPDGRRWIKAISKVPLVVSCSPLPDESTLWADFVLPDHTYLERWEIVEPVPGLGYPMLGLRQPAVEPLYDTMPTGDVVIRLAREIGEPLAGAFPWKHYRSAVLRRLEGVHKARSGSTVATSISKFHKGLRRDGGWWAPGYPFEQWGDAFHTPSGKFEFYSQTIAARLAKVFPDAEERDRYLEHLGVATRGDDLCLPHWEPPRFAGDTGTYPFVLLPYRGIDYAEGGARHLPWLCELPIQGRSGGWVERIELHPDDAGRIDVREGETVWVSSPAGKRLLTACLQPGIRPGTVGLPLGHGSWPPDPSAAEPAGVYGLIANANDPLTGVLALQGTRVRIEKVRS